MNKPKDVVLWHDGAASSRVFVCKYAALMVIKYPSPNVIKTEWFAYDSTLRTAFLSQNHSHFGEGHMTNVADSTTQNGTGKWAPYQWNVIKLTTVLLLDIVRYLNQVADADLLPTIIKRTSFGESSDEKYNQVIYT